MKPEIARKIVTLNHQFYQSFADDFSETRGRLQVGVANLLEKIPSDASVLDLGCGNGNVALQLAQNHFQGSYLGADFSPGLLKWAGSEVPDSFRAQFLELDLTAPSWNGILPPTRFEVICCFATLHHIPSKPLRTTLCKNIRQFLEEDGVLYLSAWQFIKSERLRKKILPWETVDISPNEVDQGDYLLDWQRGGSGIRYIHLLNPQELAELAHASGFNIKESFDSDGEGGNLGHYQVWVPS